MDITDEIARRNDVIDHAINAALHHFGAEMNHVLGMVGASVRTGTVEACARAIEQSDIEPRTKNHCAAIVRSLND